MLNFKNIDILINNSGVICENASITSNNSLQSVYTLGNTNSTLEPNASIRNNIRIDYLLNSAYDPNFTFLTGAKGHIDLAPITLEIAGISTSAYLENFSIQVTPNQPVKGTASYFSYVPLTGNIYPKRGTVNYTFDTSGLLHGWTTYVTSSGNYLSLPTYQFNYDVNLEWEPIYTFGSKYPTEMFLLGGVEKIQLVRNTFTPVTFSGENVTNGILGPNSESQINMSGLAFSWNANQQAISFGVANAKVITSQLTAKAGENLETSITINSSF